MSGGHFDYAQYRIHDIAMAIEELIKSNEVNVEYSQATIDEFKTAVTVLKQAEIYAQRIDWLVSGDDGEETFHDRLRQDLAQLEEK